jgi:hypothetical protein
LEIEELRIEYNRGDRLRIDNPRALKSIWDAPNRELTFEEPLKSLGFIERGEGGLDEVPKLSNLDESPWGGPLWYPLQILRIECRDGELNREDREVECATRGCPTDIMCRRQPAKLLRFV